MCAFRAIEHGTFIYNLYAKMYVNDNFFSLEAMSQDNNT